jgi:serine protease inhibitor
VTRHLDFALSLFRELDGAGDKKGNVVWSPYSVASALGISATGARGTTYDELTQVLGGDLARLGQELTSAARLDDAEVAVANTLWARLGLAFADDYQQAVLGWPGGAVHAADFGGDPEGSRVKINADVEKTTRGLIKDLLAQGVITADTAAVIVNALYLKVAWRQAFPDGATEPRMFQAPSGDRDVPAMRQEQRMPYAETAGWRLATLPTESDIVVDVLLPERDLTVPDAATLNRLYGSAAPSKIDLILPKFRVEGSATLNEPLSGLGVAAAFDPDNADFSGITRDRRIWIDRIVHRAVLSVDEQGFEGAAATAVVMTLASFDAGRAVPFHVDRPFLLLVRHRPTGALYFMAQVTEP